MNNVRIISGENLDKHNNKPFTCSQKCLIDQNLSQISLQEKKPNNVNKITDKT